MVAFTGHHHESLGLAIPPDRVAAMVALCGGALFTLVTSPPARITEDSPRAMADAIVRSALPA
jgi:hypothetical protein